jgi:hypothetical protein
MSRWEYCKIDLNDLPRNAVEADVLNAAGEGGWELAAIVANGIAYFKRELAVPPQAPTSRRKVSSSQTSGK